MIIEFQPGSPAWNRLADALAATNRARKITIEPRAEGVAIKVGEDVWSVGLSTVADRATDLTLPAAPRKGAVIGQRAAQATATEASAARGGATTYVVRIVTEDADQGTVTTFEGPYLDDAAAARRADRLWDEGAGVEAYVEPISAATS
jgi:hypothetical protein